MFERRGIFGRAISIFELAFKLNLELERRFWIYLSAELVAAALREISALTRPNDKLIGIRPAK